MRFSQILAVLFLLLCLPLASFAADLTIGKYALVSTVRVSRTVFDYTYRATLTNSGVNTYPSTQATLVTSAPNVTILDGELSFGLAAGGGATTSSDTFKIRVDRVSPFTEQQLSWQLKGSQAIGQAGGTFLFPSGVKLDVPAGALAQDTTITLKEFSCSDVNPILANLYTISHKQRCLAAFVAEPDGLTFQTPVTATMSVPKLETGEIPAQVVFYPSDRSHAIQSSTIDYNGTAGTLSFTLTHFSGQAASAIMVRPESACNFYSTWLTNPDCVDPLGLEEDCCLLRNSEKLANMNGACIFGTAAYNGECCRQEVVRSVSSAIDKSKGECQVLTSSLTTTFPNCLGSPTYVDNINEVTKECGSCTLRIEAPFKIAVCDEVKLKSILTCKDATGKILEEEVHSIWEVNQPQIADFIDKQGTIQGSITGNVLVTAEMIQVGSEEMSKVTPVSTNILVGCKACSLTGLTEVDMEVGEARDLMLAFTDADGQLVKSGNFAWEVAQDSIGLIGINYFERSNVKIRALKEGTGKVIFRYSNCYEEKTFEVKVNVGCKVCSIELSATEAIVALNDVMQIQAKLYDNNRNEVALLRLEDITWTSSDPAIASTASTYGAFISIHGNTPGNAIITATYRDNRGNTYTASKKIQVGMCGINMIDDAYLNEHYPNVVQEIQTKWEFHNQCAIANAGTDVYSCVYDSVGVSVNWTQYPLPPPFESQMAVQQGKGIPVDYPADFNTIILDSYGDRLVGLSTDMPDWACSNEPGDLLCESSPQNITHRGFIFENGNWTFINCPSEWSDSSARVIQGDNVFGYCYNYSNWSYTGTYTPYIYKICK